MKIIDRYIRHAIISSTLVVMLVLIGLESFMEFIGQLSNIGKGSFGILQALIYVPLQLPTDLYQLFPMTGFLGCLMGLGRLASSSQLTVMRAAGISITKIATSVIKTALWMILVVTFVGEMIAPRMQNYAQTLQDNALHQILDQLTAGVWLKHDHNFIYIQGVQNPLEITDIHQFNFTPTHQLMNMEYSPYALKEKNGWQLYHTVVTTLTPNKTQLSQVEKMPLPISFEPALVQQPRYETPQDSVVGLLKTILYRKKAGLVTNLYEFSLWQRIIQPITTVVMICLGVPFIFGSLRSVSMGSRIVTGIMIGFGFYMLNQFFGPITLVYQMAPWMAAGLPTLVFLVVYLILLRKVI